MAKIIDNETKESVLNTIGYREADNKESFEAGASVAFIKAEKFFESEIESLKTDLEHYKTMYESTLKDVETIVDIFEKYQHD